MPPGLDWRLYHAGCDKTTRRKQTGCHVITIVRNKNANHVMLARVQMATGLAI